jgi:hypothetical protein
MSGLSYLLLFFFRKCFVSVFSGRTFELKILMTPKSLFDNYDGGSSVFLSFRGVPNNLYTYTYIHLYTRGISTHCVRARGINEYITWMWISTGRLEDYGDGYIRRLWKCLYIYLYICIIHIDTTMRFGAVL